MPQEPALRVDQPGAVVNTETPCGLELVAGLIGQPEATLADLQLPGNVRVIPPGALVTQDMIPERLNIRLDVDGIITEAYCG